MLKLKENQRGLKCYFVHDFVNGNFGRFVEAIGSNVCVDLGIEIV